MELTEQINLDGEAHVAKINILDNSQISTAL